MEKKRQQLGKKNYKWTKLTSKGIHTVKVGNHLHTNMLPKPEITRRRVQMQETGDSFTIKRPATENNLVYI